MRILNIGCGTKTSSHPDVTNIDWSMYLVIKTNPLLRQLSRFVLDRDRLAKLEKLPDSIMVHDLRKGIPFADGSVDVVYHSHFLEHLDPPHARLFLREVQRVLKPGGIQRIVVPDFERLCAEYLTHLQQALEDTAEVARHDAYVSNVIEQMVRRESYLTNRQSPGRRALERFILGDARKRGETHQWMYDRVNLSHILRESGYHSMKQERYDTSRVPGWNSYGLDTNESGLEYKPESLYLEAAK